jgi:hypothetical protein
MELHSGELDCGGSSLCRMAVSGQSLYASFSICDQRFSVVNIVTQY